MNWSIVSLQTAFALITTFEPLRLLSTEASEIIVTPLGVVLSLFQTAFLTPKRGKC